MPGAAVFVPHPDALFSELSETSGVLVHVSSRFYYSLNRPGLFIWKWIAAGEARTEDALVGRLVQTFDVSPEQARQDVRRLLEDLVAEHLLTRATGG